MEKPNFSYESLDVYNVDHLKNIIRWQKDKLDHISLVLGGLSEGDITQNQNLSSVKIEEPPKPITPQKIITTDNSNSINPLDNERYLDLTPKIKAPTKNLQLKHEDPLFQPSQEEIKALIDIAKTNTHSEGAYAPSPLIKGRKSGVSGKESYDYDYEDLDNYSNENYGNSSEEEEDLDQEEVKPRKKGRPKKVEGEPGIDYCPFTLKPTLESEEEMMKEGWLIQSHPGNPKKRYYFAPEINVSEKVSAVANFLKGAK